MTRCDYVLVAKVVRQLPKGEAAPVKNLVTEAFVKEFLKDKPTFNADAFRKECSK